ncbi:universal stress protein [Methanosalsum natronophilum]|uniref:Universal stress protein n=1 Tax=Methanosalsum natronophilum TaxID=768733 RepID=A0A424Z4I1_9EURY|nr:universal stress protein [Methanosalsum natronophilum]MCS3924222.1 nucleotide-binding universal stress UspA family protein [Methanosalsum natronophilum]RQD92067.1 MAG: universal stress protein [Methanosalsum natronophilum]
MESTIYKNILIATDGSEHSENTIKYGVELAKLSGARLFAVYVVDTGAFASIPMDAEWEMMYSLLQDEGKKATERVEEMSNEYGVEVEQVLLDGQPAHEIIDFAEKNNISVIIMGTHGKSGLDRFLLGSVAERVIRSSDIPVFVVRMSDDDNDE